MHKFPLALTNSDHLLQYTLKCFICFPSFPYMKMKQTDTKEYQRRKTKNKLLHTYGTLLALYLSNFTRQIQDVLRPGLDLLLCLILDHDKGLRRNMTNNDTLSWLYWETTYYAWVDKKMITLRIHFSEPSMHHTHKPPSATNRDDRNFRRQK